MKRGVKILLLVVLLTLALSVFVGCDNKPVYEKELLKNTQFEDVSGGALNYWYSYLDFNKSTDGKYYVSYHADGVSDAYGDTFLKLVNKSSSGNYSYIYQKVTVSKNAYYRITATMRNASLSQGSSAEFAGAGLKVLESNVVLATTKEVGGEWTEYTVYIKPKNTQEITVALSLGNVDENGVKSYAVGEAQFENVSMMRVENVPSSADVTTIFKPKEAIYELSSTEGILFIVLLAVLTVLIIVGAYFAYRKLLQNGGKTAFFNNVALTTLMLVLFGLAIRLVLSATLFARGSTVYLADIAKDFVNIGLANVYDKYPAYSPLSIYQIWVSGWFIKDMTSIAAQSVVLRLTAILCEGISIAILYLFARKYTTEKLSALIAGLYACLPVMFTLSSGYDVIVPVLSMLLLIIFVCIIEKKNVCLLIACLIGVLWSPIVIYILPFVALYEIMSIIKAKNKKPLIILYSVGWVVSFFSFILISAPAIKDYFCANGYSFFHIFYRYSITMFKSQNCVSNAFNLYGLFKLNNVAVNTTAFWLNLVFCAILLAYTLSLYFKNKNRGELMLISGFFLTTVAVFSLNMTETAMAIGLILLLAYIAITGEERLFWVFGWFALLSFVNVGVVMNMSGALGAVMKRVYFAHGSVIYAFGNVIAALTTLYYGYVVYDITTNGKRVSLIPMKNKEVE